MLNNYYYKIIIKYINRFNNKNLLMLITTNINKLNNNFFIYLILKSLFVNN